MVSLRLLALSALAFALIACIREDALKADLPDASLSKTQIIFCFGGDMWIVGRSGRRSAPAGGLERRCSGPIFSPDGSKVAYTSTVDGNTDVYVVDAEGGVPVRLPTIPDTTSPWLGLPTEHGSYSPPTAQRREIFRSSYCFPSGGFPRTAPSSSVRRRASRPIAPIRHMPTRSPTGKCGSGGETTPIWIADLSDSSVVKVLRDKYKRPRP